MGVLRIEKNLIITFINLIYEKFLLKNSKKLWDNLWDWWWWKNERILRTKCTETIN